MSRVPWQTRAEVARTARDKSLSRVDPCLGSCPESLPLSSQDLPRQLLTAREYELTQNYDALALLELLRDKKLSSEELTRAFLRRAAIAQHAVRKRCRFQSD